MVIPRRLRTAALLALTMFSSQAAIAFAQPGAPSAGTGPTTAPPITIAGSNLTTSGGKASRTWLVLQFRNEAKVAADEVRFLTRYDGSENVVVDKGLFSPGTMIVHRFITGPLPGFRGTTDCTVGDVHFTDGTYWESASLKRSRPQGTQPGAG